MSEWFPYFVLAIGIIGHTRYLLKVRRYRYYSNLFVEVDRQSEPKRFEKWARGDAIATAALGILLIAGLIINLSHENLI